METDIIRFHKNEIYHLDCYVKFINKDNSQVLACPRCYTTGKIWSKKNEEWVKCRLCKGAGFLLIEEES